MSTPYIRRPQLQGNTDVPVLSQPYLQGTARRDVNGEIPDFATLVATTPADLVVETEATTSGPVTVTFTVGHSALLRDILVTLNAGLAGVAQAEERDGCVRLTTLGVGDTITGRAFIRVHPATTDWNGDGVADSCSGTLGFYEYPAPEATAFAGDIESAAARPLEQGNPNSTKFVARGEDRLSAAFNRGMAQLASNADVVRTAGYRPAAYPTKITVDSSVLAWTGRLRYDGDGSVTQIDLSDLTTIDADLSGRFYVAGLSRTSTLRDIARQFLLTDTAGHEISAFDETASETRTLRVAAVTRGENGYGAPSFADEVSAPASPLPDTTGVPVDGANALGVARTKIAATPITEIRNGTNLVCASLLIGSGFQSQGVVSGDLLTISSSTVSIPYTNDGLYIVESVVSEQEVIVRPYADTDVRPLNESTSGSFGFLTVSSGGEWEAGLWVTLTPPLARFPEDGKLVVTVGLERDTLNQRRDLSTATDDASFSRHEPELTGFEINQLWQRQGLTGAYAGMSTDRTSDAGSILNTRTRPVTILAPEKSVPSAGVYVRGPFTGELIAGGILKAEYAAVPPHPDTFTLGDLGRVVKLSGGSFVDLEPYLITEFIDGAHVRLAPLGVEAGDELPDASGVEYEVYEEVVEYPNATLELIAPDQGKNETAKTDVGILYLREQNNGSSPPTMVTRKHGQSLVHLERVSIGYLGGTAVDIRTIVISSIRIDAGTSVATVDKSVEEFQNIFAMDGGDDRSVEPPYNGASVFRIFNGPNAGYYLVKRTYSTNEIKLVTLDGEDVLLDTSVATTQIGAFYNAHVAVGHTLAGKYGDVEYRTAKLRVFFDSLEQGEEAGVGLSLDWRGQGAGISAQLNDADFVAYDSEAGATGYLIDAQIYSPAHGINLSVTGADSGEAERRSARGMRVSVDGHQLEATPANWGRILGGETLSSWGAHIHQEGSDPALVVTKGVDVGTDFAHPTDAAVQVRMAPIGSPGTRVYRATGGALDVTGSIYLRRTLATPGGAMYSETGVSVFQYIASMVPPYFNNRRDGIYAFDNPEGATELGSADQAYPTLANTAAPSADLLPPDYAKFPFHHHGVVQVLNDADFSDFLSPLGLGAERHVGKVIEVSDSYAYGTVTVLGPVTNGKTVTIGGISLLADATPDVTNDQFQSGVAAIATATSLAAAINDPSGSLYGTVTAVADGAIVTITAVAVGSAGNTIALVTDAPTELSLSGALLYPSANGTFTVHALHVVQAGDDAYVAVTAGNLTTPWAVGQTGTFRMYGRRWHRAYLNIADFALLGTWDTSAERTDLPALTSVDQLVNDRQTEIVNDTQFPSMGLQSIVSWGPIADGASLGFDSALIDPSMARVAVDATTYAAASSWSGGSEGPSFGHGWSRDTQQPRSPFPNRALFSGGESNTGDVTVAPGSLNSLAADDYTATFPTGAGMSVYWSENWGGTLAAEFTSGALATALIWQKGRTYVLTAHLALRVRLRIAGNLSTTGLVTTRLSVQLCKADGTIIAQQPTGISPGVSLSSVPEDQEYLLTLDSLYKGAHDALNESLQTAQLYIVLSINTNDTGTAYVLEFTAEQETRPAVVSGPQVVAGSQLAHSYRFTDPIRGFQTVGPADARLFGGVDYAKNESWPTYDNGSSGWTASFTTGTQELRGTPGLVRMSSELQMYHWYAVADAAALAPTNTWLTNLQTAIHSGIHWAQEEEDAADAAIVAAIATPASPAAARAEALDAVADAITALLAALTSILVSVYNSDNLSRQDKELRYSAIHNLEDAIEAALEDPIEGGDYGTILAHKPLRNWVRPWVDYHRLFTQGVHSAAVTLYNGAFDPLWYAYQADKLHNDFGESTEDLQVSAFVLPGTTGFLLPLAPPHGAALTSLSVNLSFRPANENVWGVYFAMPDELAQLGQSGADSMSYQDVANEDLWNAKQGVIVEIWRHNSVDFGVEEGQFASWTEHTPEFGFGECIFRQNVNISEETIPGRTDNTVENAWEQATSGDTVANRDAYVGKELFVRRTWNLIEYFGSADARSRVDGRQYSYMLVVRFYGGTRKTNAGVQLPYVRGDSASPTGETAEPRWEIPQVITRLKDDGVFTAFTLAEGRLYGHFDAGYDTETLNMNAPWGSGSFPPQVKFRGARLGWITDRAGDGGWG